MADEARATAELDENIDELSVLIEASHDLSEE